MRGWALLAFSMACAAPHRATVLAQVPLVEPQPIAEPSAEPASPPAEESETVRDVAGFTVHVSPAAARVPELRDFLVGLYVNLSELLEAFPVAARTTLQGIPFYLTERSRDHLTFHPSEDWLREHHVDTSLAHAIEVPSVAVGLADLERGAFHQGMATLVAQGYFVRQQAPAFTEAQALFEAAKKSGRWTAARATNGLTYFGILSAAYFGRAVPPDRNELRVRDPRGFAFVARQWPADAFLPKPPIASVKVQAVSGFDVWVDKTALAHTESAKALAMVRARLDTVSKTLAASPALTTLRKFTIVMRWKDPPDLHPLLLFHDGFVDVPDIASFVAGRPRASGIIHELGHAFARAHPELDPRIREAYAHARDAHLYDYVEWDGHYGRAYASTNAAEYFAELSKTYITQAGEWYPHTRADLAKHDPMGYRLMVDAWGPL